MLNPSTKYARYIHVYCWSFMISGDLPKYFTHYWGLIRVDPLHKIGSLLLTNHQFFCAGEVPNINFSIPAWIPWTMVCPINSGEIPEWLWWYPVVLFQYKSCESYCEWLWNPAPVGGLSRFSTIWGCSGFRNHPQYDPMIAGDVPGDFPLVVGKKHVRYPCSNNSKSYIVD